MAEATEQQQDFEDLVEYIRTNRGFDFTGYKRPSLLRRFAKRMQTLGIASHAEYREYLEHNPDEFIDLFNTILINVTAFFRDAAAWEYLRSEIVPAILADADGADAIRIWSTGCASGEEAYSLAICFAEAMPDGAFRDKLKIYATDVDEEALAEARHGIYPATKLENMSPELRDRYFERLEQRWLVKPELRRAVIFGRHDVVQDPPISRIDLLASRNTLMYFTPDAQSRILTNFHFALRNGGYLFLGKSETMLSRSSLFAAVDLKRRVFRKLSLPEAYRPLPRPRPPEGLEPAEETALMREVGFETAPIAQLVVDRAGCLTLANMQARTLFGLAQRDIGRPLKDLEVSYKPVELRSQIDRAYAERHTLSLRDVEWLLDGGEHRVMDVQIAPLTSGEGTLVGVGISFVDVTRYKRLQEAVEHSKRDVEVAYEELQSTVEELETTNEELQSTNEELETMNEELQSTNEELETINDELNQRTDELNHSNFFLESILASIEAGVVVLDEELRVIGWNDGARELWGLRGEEVQGQHFMNLDIGLPVEQVSKPLRAVLAGLEPQPTAVVEANEGAEERTVDSTLDVRSYDGSPLPPERWPPARALAGETVRGERVIVERADGGSIVLDVSAAPLTDPRRPLGAVVIFTDVTEREQEERTEREFVENAAHQLRSPITAIASAVGALEAGAKDHPVAREQFITHVARESERMARLAETLLLLTRFQQRSMPPATRLVQLAPLLEELVAAARPRPGVGVTLSCDGRLGALCHPGMVREAIDNLIRNAIEHTTSGSIRVSASREGDAVVVEVADSGPGIPPEARGRVFERFFQVGYGPKRGAGLGLAIAAEAAAANGGRLELLPTPPGTGATFRFSLPGALLV